MLLGKSDKTFSAPISFPTVNSSTPLIVAINDFNNDAQPYIFYTNEDKRTINILNNNVNVVDLT